uniref:Uncharacterized protein n=1 Tax=Aegilops tauschii subsp. strangulata TaxID=200361 RepID=A0A453EXJ6_AEGTS
FFPFAKKKERRNTYSSPVPFSPRAKAKRTHKPKPAHFSSQGFVCHRRDPKTQAPNPSARTERGGGGGNPVDRRGDGVLRAARGGRARRPHQPAAPRRLRRPQLPLLLQAAVRELRGDERAKTTCVSLDEVVQLPTGKGTANLLQKCKLCSREGSVVMIPGQGTPLTLLSRARKER